MIAVTLGIRWIELFGENKSKMPDKMRRSRWEKWKQLCRDNGGFEIVEYWSTPDSGGYIELSSNPELAAHNSCMTVGL